MNDDKCTCEEIEYPDHPCPYQEEIWDDNRDDDNRDCCNCCPHCEQECAWDI